MDLLKNWFGYHRKAKAKQRTVLEDLAAESSLIVRESRLHERRYIVVLANSFATPVEAKNAAIRISERMAAEEGVFVVMELTYDITPVEDA